VPYEGPSEGADDDGVELVRWPREEPPLDDAAGDFYEVILIGQVAGSLCGPQCALAITAASGDSSATCLRPPSSLERLL